MIASLVKKFSSLKSFPELQIVTCAASLAHHSFIKSIPSLLLSRLDLSLIPVDQLASLVSCVTWSVEIRSDVTGCDLLRFIDSLRCEWLYIGVNMGSEETQALVKAMESHVVNVMIRGSWKMTLDITELTKYSGQGKCSQIHCYGYVDVFKEELMTWAQRKNWKTELINNGPLYFKRVVKP